MIETQSPDMVLKYLLPETDFTGRYAPAATLAERMTFYHTPGVSVAVIEDGQTAWAQGYGLVDVTRPDPVTTQTLFMAGSISKPFTALAVMRLVAAGRLDLDVDVNQYLTSWQVPAKDGWQPRVTLRHLLSHTGGLTVHGFPGYQHDEPLPTTIQVLNGVPPANTRPVQVNILPGLQFRYAGGGTTIVQQLLVDVLGKPFPDLMQELVLGPLGMADSTYANPLPAIWAGRAATGHPWKGVPLRGRYHTYPEMAAAGLWTTPVDMAKAGVELMRILRGETSPFLQQETMAEMITPQLPGGDVRGGEEVGLGFFIEGEGAARRFGHGGWDEGFIANLRLYPQTGQGAVVMLNANEGHPLVSEIYRTLGQVYGWPEEPPAAQTAVEMADLEAYTGRYVTEVGVEFDVRLQEGGLVLKPAGQLPLPLQFSAVDACFTTLLNVTMVFGRDEEEKVTKLTIQQSGQNHTAMRI